MDEQHLRALVGQRLDVLAADPPRGRVVSLTGKDLHLALPDRMTLTGHHDFLGFWSWRVYLDDMRSEVSWWGPWNPAARFAKAWRAGHEAAFYSSVASRIGSGPAPRP